MMERSLVIVKPDGVARGLVGEVIKRFEQRGIKIVGMKMQWINEEFAKKHYTEDITKRRGEKVRKNLLKYITEGPVVVMVLEGVNVVDNIRKIVGDTEPKSALPGTVRGDYSHMSFTHADANEIGIPNILHASGDSEEAKAEIAHWFSKSELFDYETAHEKFTQRTKFHKR